MSNNNGGSDDMMDEYAQLPRLAGVLESVKRHCSEKNIDLSSDTRNAIWQVLYSIPITHIKIVSHGWHHLIDS
jgi:hypothetical protein